MPKKILVGNNSGAEWTKKNSEERLRLPPVVEADFQEIEEKQGEPKDDRRKRTGKKTEDHD